LLAHGAEVDLINVFQMTPLMIAAGMRGTGRGTAMTGDAQARAVRSINLLLDAGAKINAQVTNSHTRTAVLMAYIAGRDQEGRTALFAAAEAGADTVVEHLLERGADPMIQDAVGKTALDYARTTTPAATGGGQRGAPASEKARAAVAALLEAAMQKSGVPAAAKPAPVK
jgi:ankyrin repeat protein